LTAELWSGGSTVGTLLAELKFTPAEPGTLVNSNRLKPLAVPLVLAPGDYTIVAHGYGAAEPAGHEGFGGPGSQFKTLDDGQGAISFVGSRLGTSPGAFPTQVEGGSVNFYSAGTFQFNLGGSGSEVVTNIQAQMHTVNTTAYVRIPFGISDVSQVLSMTLDVQYNDGFVAYINGQEAASLNAPTSRAWNATATTSVGGFASAVIDLSAGITALQNGTNVLAVHGLNAQAADGRFLIAPRLSTSNGAPGKANLALNEVAAGGSAEFFLEITNDSPISQSVAGFVLVTSSGDQYVLPNQTIFGGGHLSLTNAQLGFTPAVGENLFLFSAGQGQLSDARKVSGRLRGRSVEHDGRWLYPDTATPGDDNHFNFEQDVVINEILYHPHGESLAAGGDIQTSPFSETTPLVLSGDQGSHWVPSDDTLGTGWTSPAFDDSSWTRGPSGVGFEAGGVSGIMAYGNLAGANGTSPLAFSYGHDFVVNSRMMVTHLGVFDSGANGLSRTLTAELWSRNGDSGLRQTLLQFTQADPGALVGSNRLKPLPTPLVLDPGDYTVVAHGYGSGEAAGNEGFGGPGSEFKTLDDGGGVVSFVGSRLGTTPGFFPTIAEPASANYYSAGTFLFESASVLSPLVNTNVESSMYGVNSTVYLRHEFNATAPSADELAELILKMKYDDGFVAYLNGSEVARRNAPASSTWNSTSATASQVLSEFESIDISAHVAQLVTGTNVLAVHGLNQSASDSDFLILPELVLTTLGSPQQEWLELYNRGTTAVDLSGWTVQDAIEFEFFPGTTIPSEGYLVVAKHAGQLSANHPGIDVVGNYSGRLNNRTERILLVDANENPADEVEYFEGGRWDDRADGGGSSLELRDVHADNSRGEAWAPSEISNSTWNTYTFRGTARSDDGPKLWEEFVVGLLDGGEVLIDDVSLRRDPDGVNHQEIQNGSFQSDTLGGQASNWRIIGNHHGTVVTDPDNPANKVLHVVAEGAARHEHDHANTDATIVNGSEYEFSLRAKWLSGSPLLNVRLYWNRLAHTFAMQRPQQTGTPGAANSTRESNIGPTFSGLSHLPVRPKSVEEVKVQVTAEDPDSVTSMKVHWRVGNNAFSSLAMTPLGDGRYEGTIPGQSAGLVVQFYVEGQDSRGATATFPAAGPDSRALYEVNDGQGTNLPIDTIQLVMLPQDSAFYFENTTLLSNKYHGATLTVNEQEVYYDVKARRKGSIFARSGTSTMVSYRVNLKPDNLFRGVHDRIGLDAGGSRNLLPDSQDEILAKHLISHAGGITSLYDDLAYMVAPINTQSDPIILQLARYDDVYLDEQFSDGSDGSLFKMVAIPYSSHKVPGTGGLKDGLARGHIGCCDITDKGDDKEDYRLRFLLRNNRERDDFDRIVKMNQAFSLTGDELQAAVDKLLDIDQWMRTYAMMSLLGVLDVYTVVTPQNSMLYVRPEDNKIMVFPHDWDQSWYNPVNDPLHGTKHPNMTKVFDLPANERLHLGHLHDLINTTFNRTYATPWASHLGGLVGQNFGAHPGYIQNRANFVLSRLPAQIPFQITSSPPLDVGAASTATIQGQGWINVREIRLSGMDQPLEVTWSAGAGANFANTWEVTIPVTGGTHPTTLMAYDYQGVLMDWATINVTSSTSNPIVDWLRISEINYNPGEPTAAEQLARPGVNNNDFEYIELQNIGDQSLDLLGTSFSDGISASLPAFSLAAGERGVVVRDLAAFRLRYGSSIHVLGEFASGGLSDTGENLTLVDSQNQTVLNFSYGDNDPWPERADGHGGTLELIDPVGTPIEEFSKYYRWRGSTELGGTPATAGAGPVGVVINEVLANTDARPESDSIELFNTTGATIDISNWWVSDSAENFIKYQVPAGTLLAAGKMLVLSESEFNPTPLVPEPDHFGLSSGGDDVWLVDPAGGATGVPWLVDDVHFGATASGESMGRVPDGSGRLAPQVHPTLGAANTAARVGPLVITEVNYNPSAPSAAALAIHPTLTSDDLELIEVFNPTASAVDLTDWRIRGGVDYDFTSGTTLDAGQSLVVVSFNPDDVGNVSRRDALGAHYELESSVRLVGGYQGQLSDRGERLQLQRPGTAPAEDLAAVPRLWEDEVLYDDLAPWPTEADGSGHSLQRITVAAYGNDSASWTAAPPSPGRFSGSSMAGDFNDDQIVDDADIDQLFTALQAGSGDLQFDVDGSGTVTSADVTFLVESILGTSFGDVDLDGDVDTGDLTRAIINFTSAQGSGKTWSQGDTDGDGDVDTSDLTRSIIHFTGAQAASFARAANSLDWPLGLALLKEPERTTAGKMSIAKTDALQDSAPREDQAVGMSSVATPAAAGLLVVGSTSRSISKRRPLDPLAEEAAGLEKENHQRPTL